MFFEDIFFFFNFATLSSFFMSENLLIKFLSKKTRIRESPNLSTDADSSTNILVFAGVKKGADSIFFYQIFF